MVMEVMVIVVKVRDGESSEGDSDSSDVNS